MGLCLVTAAYCILGASWKLHRVSISVAPVGRVNPGEPEITGTGFARNEIYPQTVLPPFKGTVNMYGSWATPVLSSGSAHSAWYKPVPHFAIFFCGYPNRLHNRLFVEVETARAGIIHLSIGPEFIPLEAWWLKNFSLPEDKQPLRFRIVAAAAPQDSQGWLGFSDPFIIQSVDNFEICKQLLLIFLAAAASIVTFLAPGLILRRSQPKLHFIWIPIPGILLFSLIGLAAWLAPTAITQRLVCRIGLFSVIAYAVYHFIRFPLSSYTRSTERQVLFVFLLLVLIGTAKSTYSLGPAGELFAGRVSRTLEVGAKSDSRFQYHTIQLVRFRKNTYGPFAHSLYAPWSFSSRGPIAGLAVAPIVLFTRANVAAGEPDQPWSPFDPEGFEAYRIGMIVLECCGLIAVFGLATMFLPGDWAFFAFLIAATAPFTIHEIFFTWPKLLEAGCVLIAAYLVFRRHYLFGGIMLGFGYLIHPAALFFSLSLAGIIALQEWNPSAHYKWIARIGATASGVALCLLLWQIINYGHNAQSYFLTYFKLTAGAAPTTANWFRSRFDSLLNTLVPFNLIIFHRLNLDLQSIYAFSPRIIEYSFVYCDTFPFAVGIAFFFAGIMRLLYIACRKALVWLILLFVVPLAALIVYWGWGSSGLMREGLHAWFLALIIFLVVMWHRFLLASDLFFRLCNWALLFRGVETIWVLLVPTVASQNAFVQKPFVLSDITALITMTAATLWLYLYLFRFARKLQLASAVRTRSIGVEHNRLEELR